MEEAGGKGAHLGEMTRAGFRVPSGFVVLADSFYHHLAQNGLEPEIRAVAKDIDYDDYVDLDTKADSIRRLIEEAPIPRNIAQEVLNQYADLFPGDHVGFVAVRSSVAIKDSTVSSFPGLMDTFHYLKGGSEVLESIRKVWASVWSARATFTRNRKEFDHWKAVIAPVVQKMVDADKAGVAFTINPINGSKDDVVIEANFGLGEGVVSGQCLTDMWVVSKGDFAIKSENVSIKNQACVQKPGGGRQWVQLDSMEGAKPSLTPGEVERVRDLAIKVEEHYGVAQDIEWAFEGEALLLLQARKAKAAGE